MKKTLLFFSILSAFYVKTQVLESDNYDSYILGNIGSYFDYTFYINVPGQGGMFTSPNSPGSAANYSQTNFQIVSIDANHGKSLQIISPGATGGESERKVYKQSFASAWNGRNLGNNIVKVDLEIYTGNAAGNAVKVGAKLGNSVGIYYNTQMKRFYLGVYTKEINGSQTTQFNLFLINTPQTFPSNTWVSVGFSYNTLNQEITYTIDGVTSVWSPGYFFKMLPKYM
jgi:hypothetical protein